MLALVEQHGATALPRPCTGTASRTLSLHTRCPRKRPAAHWCRVKAHRLPRVKATCVAAVCQRLTAARISKPVPANVDDTNPHACATAAHSYIAGLRRVLKSSTQRIIASAKAAGGDAGSWSAECPRQAVRALRNSAQTELCKARPLTQQDQCMLTCRSCCSTWLLDALS